MFRVSYVQGFLYPETCKSRGALTFRCSYVQGKLQPRVLTFRGSYILSFTFRVSYVAAL